nr:hypothetical protein Itr_chr12CG18320 [Ipomoea trifida]
MGKCRMLLNKTQIQTDKDGRLKNGNRTTAKIGTFLFLNSFQLSEFSGRWAGRVDYRAHGLCSFPGFFESGSLSTSKGSPLGFPPPDGPSFSSHSPQPTTPVAVATQQPQVFHDYLEHIFGRGSPGRPAWHNELPLHPWCCEAPRLRILSYRCLPARIHRRRRVRPDGSVSDDPCSDF